MLLHGGSTADSEVHYLQLLGTYLVGTVPKAAPLIDCADAVVLPTDVQAQSILPDKLEEDPNFVSVPALLMNGERRSVFAPVNCEIWFAL